MKIHFKIIFIFITSVLLISCSEKNEDRTVITFWAMGSEGENAAPFLKQFEERNPGIKINLQTIPFSSAHDKLITAFAGSSTPDICQLGNTWVSEFSAMDALAPLDEYISVSKIVSSEKYFEGSWQTGVIDGKVFAVPWYVETRALFYRVDLLKKAGYDKAPDTWEEFIDAASKLSIDENNDGKPDRFGIYLPINPNLEPIEVLFILQNGGTILNDNNEYANLNNRETIEAINFYVSFFRKGASPTEQNQMTNLYQAFESGYIGMFLSGPWNVSQIQNRYPELNDKWSVAPLPKSKDRSSNAGGSSLVIFNSSKNKLACWKLIEFLSEVNVQREFYKATSDLPAVQEAWSDTSLFNNKRMNVFYEQLKHSKAFPKIPEMEQILDKMGQYVEMVIFSKRTTEEAIKGMESDINRILDKRRWLNRRKNEE